MERACFTDRFVQHNRKIIYHCKTRLQKRFKQWKIVIDGCYPLFVDKWFGYLDGQTKEGETFDLNFIDNKRKFNSGDNSPVWAILAFINNGNDVTWQINGFNYCFGPWGTRSVGVQGKIELAGKFKKQQGMNWNLVQ